ncbi:hypothetical protein ABEF95_007956 [Exophiala dermatitidis]
MADPMPRKKSLGFLNLFRSKQSRSPNPSHSTRASSVSECNSIEKEKANLKLEQTDTRSPRPTNKLRKKSTPNLRSTKSNTNLRHHGANRTQHHPPMPAISLADEWERDAQTGERKDHTEMLHSLAYRDSAESLAEKTQLLFAGIPAQPASEFVSRLPRRIWKRVVDYLVLVDAASLAFSCKPFLGIVGTNAWHVLNTASDEAHYRKIEFLNRLDQDLPDHLLCFPCAIYHLRIHKGQEILRPTNIANPLFNCPNAFNPDKKVSRIRLTVGKTLPFPFVQLILRADKYSLDYGIPIDSMSRRYKDRDSEWTHQTRYAVVNGHLLMRVISSAFAEPALPPAGLRKLLYSPNENFTPYFSVCAHWKDGELMPSVKCALSHLPEPVVGSGIAGAAARVRQRMDRPSPVVTLCPQCKPMRRCPECPSEYLIEVRMQEDRTDPTKLFKHAIVVTRWSDLGDGSSPYTPEWASCNGEAVFDSFKALGKRAISGVFESQFTVDQIPGQKIVSMNPHREHLGEAGHNWY